MAEEKKMLTRVEFESEIIKKAWKDPAYKQRLLKSPKEVLEEELGRIREGIRLPEKMEVHVHEETPYSIHISIPANPVEYAAHIEGEEIGDETALGTIGFVIIAAASFAVTANVAVAANAAAAANVNVAANINAAANVNATVNATI